MDLDLKTETLVCVNYSTMVEERSVLGEAVP